MLGQAIYDTGIFFIHLESLLARGTMVPSDYLTLVRILAVVQV